MGAQPAELRGKCFSPSMDAVSLFFLFSAGVKFQVLEQQDGKPLRLLMQVSHVCPVRHFPLWFPPRLLRGSSLLGSSSEAGPTERPRFSMKC